MNLVSEKFPLVILGYVCGPYRAKTIFGVYENIQRAKDRSVELVKSSIYPVVPHLCTAFLDGLAEDDEFFLPSVMELMRRCDAVYLVKGWEKSSGAVEEVKEAFRMDIDVYDENNNKLDELSFKNRIGLSYIRSVK